MLNSVLVYHDSIMSAFMFFSVLAAFLAAAVGLKASAKVLVWLKNMKRFSTITNASTKTLLHHLSRYIRSRMKGWRFLFQGPTMIQRAFDKVFSVTMKLDSSLFEKSQTAILSRCSRQMVDTFLFQCQNISKSLIPPQTQFSRYKQLQSRCVMR